MPPNDTDLEALSHARLMWLRANAGNNPEAQAALAPAEHAAFAREAVAENPWMAAPIAAAAPVYTAGKALGLIKARSPASWEELGGAWAGAGQGLVQALKNYRAAK